MLDTTRYRLHGNIYSPTTDGRASYTTMAKALVSNQKYLAVNKYPVALIFTDPITSSLNKHSVSGAIAVYLKCTDLIFEKIIKDVVNIHIKGCELSWATKVIVDFVDLNVFDLHKVFHLVPAGNNRSFISEINCFYLDYCGYNDYLEKLNAIYQTLVDASKFQVLE